MTDLALCESPGCEQMARWFVGHFLEDTLGRGHFSCDRHLSDACLITLGQFWHEGRDTGKVTVMEISSSVTVTAEP